MSYLQYKIMRLIMRVDFTSQKIHLFVSQDKGVLSSMVIYEIIS